MWNRRDAAIECAVPYSVIRYACDTGEIPALHCSTREWFIPETALRPFRYDPARPRITIKAAARRMNVTTTRVGQMIKEGKIEALRIGGSYRVYKHSIIEYESEANMYNTTSKFICTEAMFPHLMGLCKVGSVYQIVRVGPTRYRISGVDTLFNFLSLKDAADECGVTKVVLREAVKREQIPAIECTNRRILVPETALHGYREHLTAPRMSCREYAKHIGKTPARVSQMIKEGKLDTVLIGGSYRIKVDKPATTV